ncbi:MAG: hypothetical protein AAB869_00480 [Patescibacteria group bacterium]
MITNQKFIPVLFLIIGLILGFAGGSMFGGNDQASYKDEIKARLTETGALPLQPSEVKQLSGSIKAIDGKTLTLSVQYPRDPFGDPSLDERTVMIDGNTKIVVMVQKDQKIFEKELADYQNKIGAIKPGALPDPSKMPTPPQIFDKKDGDLSSLEVGQIVNITTAENVKDVKNFTAVTVEISAMAAPSTAIGVTGAVPPPPPLVVAPTNGGTSAPPPPAGATGGVAPAPPQPAGTGGTVGAPFTPPLPPPSAL